MTINPSLYRQGKVFNRNSIFLAVVSKDVCPVTLSNASSLRICFCDTRSLQKRRLSATLPICSGDLRKSVLEVTQKSSTVHISFELSNMRHLTKIATHLVENFLEDRKQRIEFRSGDHISFLIDIKQDALGRN